MKINRLFSAPGAKKKKLILLASVAIYLFSSFLVLLPAHVAAANEIGTWVDDNTINFRNDDYIKHVNSGHEGYIDKNDISDLCSSGQDKSRDAAKFAKAFTDQAKIRIIRDISSDKSSAHHIVYQVYAFLGNRELKPQDTVIMSGGLFLNDRKTEAYYGCKNIEQINIDLPSTTAASQSFSWIDQAAIEGTDGNHQFSRDQASGDFIWQQDNNVCQEKITVTKGDPTSGIWSHKGKQNGGGQCSYTQTPVGIARSAENAGKLAGSGVSVSGNVPSKNETKIKCSFSTNPLTWFMCPMIEGLESIVNTLDHQITVFLTVPPDYFDASKVGSGQSFYLAWASLRTIALVLLVIIGLVMVISQALAIGPFDAYTVKKVLPRILIAVIFITLSWAAMGWMVQLSNDLGAAVRGIIEAPFNGGFGGGTVTFTGGIQSFGAIALAGAGFTLGILGLLALVATAALAVVVAFAILMLRQIIITMLAVLAPVAIVLFVLPNTQKYWKIWWESFSKALIMFPIISAFISAGRVFAKVAIVPNNDFPHQLFAFAAYFAPYFLLPTAFKMAGGALATLSGSINDRSRGAFDRLKKFRQGQTAKNWEKTKAGQRLAGGTESNFRGKLNRGFQGATLLPQAGLNPTKWKAGIGAARSARTSMLAGKAAENEHVQSVVKNDDLLQAFLHGDGSEASMREYLGQLGQNGEEIDQNIKSVQQAQRAVGAKNFGALAAVANAGTGTGYKGGPAEMLATINRVAGGDRALASRMLAGARGEAERARRGDLYGAGFAESNRQSQAMYNAGAQDDTSAAWQNANEILTDQAVNTKSAGELASGRQNSLQNLTPALQRRLARTQAASDKAEREFVMSGQIAGSDQDHSRQIARREHKRVLAHTAALLDAAGSVSPENAQLIGNEVLGQRTGGTTAVYETRRAKDAKGNDILDTTTQQPVMARVQVGTRDETYGDVIESLRTDDEFGLYRREYGRASDADAAARAAAGLGNNPNPGP